MAKSFSYLYIPIEFSVREIDGACLLALAHAEAGISVVIGPRYQLYDHIGGLPKGIFLLKSIRPAELREMVSLRDCGHQIAFLDQEGLLQYEYQYECYQKFDFNTAALCDYFFSVNSSHHELLKRYLPPDKSDKIFCVGNPRFEFCQKYASDFYSNSERKHILFTTSFGNANPFFGSSNSYLDMVAGLSLSSSSKLTESRRVELNMIMLKKYSCLLVEIAKRCPSELIVLRPHLSESVIFWENLSRDLPNVLVRANGSVYEWLANASVHLHFNSTTSLEANLMGVPSLSLSMPDGFDQFVLEDCFKVSNVFDDEECLVQSIKRKSYDIRPMPENLMPGKEALSSASAILSRLEFDVSGAFKPKINHWASLKRKARDLKNKVGTARFSNDYRDKKIHGLVFTELQARLDYLSGLSLKKAPTITQFGANCFIVWAK